MDCHLKFIITRENYINSEIAYNQQNPALFIAYYYRRWSRVSDKNLLSLKFTLWSNLNGPSWFADDSNTNDEVRSRDIYLPCRRDNEVWDYIHVELLSVLEQIDVVQAFGACRVGQDLDDLAGPVPPMFNVIESGFDLEPYSDDEVPLKDIYLPRRRNNEMWD